MKVLDITFSKLNLDEWKASRDTCNKSTPIGASAEASCKAQGLGSHGIRDSKKKQFINGRWVKMGGKRRKSTTYGGDVKDYGSRDRKPHGAGRDK
jgi:hypothetical protein